MNAPNFTDASAAAAAREPALVALKTHKNVKRTRYAALQLEASPRTTHGRGGGVEDMWAHYRSKAESFVDGVLGGNVRFTRLTSPVPHLIEELLDDLPHEPPLVREN